MVTNSPQGEHVPPAKVDRAKFALSKVDKWKFPFSKVNKSNFGFSYKKEEVVEHVTFPKF